MLFLRAGMYCRQCCGVAVTVASVAALQVLLLNTPICALKSALKALMNEYRQVGIHSPVSEQLTIEFKDVRVTAMLIFLRHNVGLTFNLVICGKYSSNSAVICMLLFYIHICDECFAVKLIICSKFSANDGAVFALWLRAQKSYFNYARKNTIVG